MTLKGFFAALGDIPGFAALYEIVKGRLKKRFVDNPRRDLMETNRLLAERNSTGAEKIMDRLRVAQATRKPAFENVVVAALGESLPRDSENRLRVNDAVDTLEYIAGFNDTQFEVFIDAMTNDSIKQVIVWFVDEYGFPGLQLIWGFLSEAARYTGQKLEKFVEDRILVIFNQPNMAGVKSGLLKIRDDQRKKADEEQSMSWYKLSWRMITGR